MKKEPAKNYFSHGRFLRHSLVSNLKGKDVLEHLIKLLGLGCDSLPSVRFETKSWVADFT